MTAALQVPALADERATAPAPRDPEQVAERLLRASAEHSYDPLVEIDWQAPLDPTLLFMPEHRCSLYGTELWASMAPRQRQDLTRHEVASMAGMGIWFETILLQLLARHLYDRDPVSRHVQYAFTEIADECRHSIMFARLCERLDAPAYRPDRLAHELARVMKTTSSGPEIFAGALIAEEILDRMQRECMVDEGVQPLVRAVNRIHVVEEARHVRYAREALARMMPRLHPAQRQVVRASTAAAAYVIASRLVHPQAYAAAGLDPRSARKAARSNPHYRATLRWAGERLVEFLTDVGMIGGPSQLLWRRAGLL